MDKKIHARGIVTADPASTLPIGAKIKIVPTGVTYEGATAPAWLKDWGSFDGILLSICISSARDHRIEGSAVLVAPGVAICARHVVDPRMDGIMRGEHTITCFAITRSGLMIWKVRKYTQIPESDLGILGLELASDLPPERTLFVSTITTRLPKEGASLLVCGFRASSGSFPKFPPLFEGNVLISKGVVTGRYPTGRDRVMIPWPSVEVSCPSWGGMSGGPVYDHNGSLVGILSSSFGCEDDNGPSYISLIWPALAFAFEGGWPGPLFPRPTRLVDLDPNICAIDRRDAISTTSDPKTGQSHIEYHMWE